MIIGIGTDIINNKRIEKTLKKFEKTWENFKKLKKLKKTLKNFKKL